MKAIMTFCRFDCHRGTIEDACYSKKSQDFDRNSITILWNAVTRRDLSGISSIGRFKEHGPYIWPTIQVFRRQALSLQVSSVDILELEPQSRFLLIHYN
jgi:hypothetical protein